MTRFAPIVALVALCLLTVGCIKRTLTIDSNPAGAVVYLNDEEIGRTPTTVPFTWYGKYDVRLEKKGYQTHTALKEAKAPWFETPGIDLLAELVPGTHHVDLQWQFELTELEPVNEEKLVDHARQIRALLNQQP